MSRHASNSSAIADSKTGPTAFTAGPMIYLETFGCQMNELDSELVRGQLAALGYGFTDDPEAAQVILYNTCSVREQAENKVLSRVGRVGIRKRSGSTVVLGVIGCMAEREGASMVTRYPQIDLMCGPGELDKLPMLLDNVLKSSVASGDGRIALQGSTTRRSSTLSAATDGLEMLDLSRAFDPERGESGGRSAYVRITRGCNKFCTYCVVPRTRGPEVHRPPDAIVDECRRLADQGVIEITLLGQTVNHYLYTHGTAITVSGREAPQYGPGAASFRNGDARASRESGAAGGTVRRATTFAGLLRRIHEEVPAVRRLRFVTSFPRDFGDDILQVMAASPRICRYLHVPAQSGSDRILKLMNRGYTRGIYLEFIDRVRAALPDASIAGDIIVGFPTETDEDYAATCSLIEHVRFKNNFIFKYSPRPGTAAWDRLPDDIPDAVKRQRNNDLLARQARISEAVHREHIGREHAVFVERQGQRSRSTGGDVHLGWAPERLQLSGRTPGDLITVFDVPATRDPDSMIGSVVRARITGAGPLILLGEMIDDAESGSLRAADSPGRPRGEQGLPILKSGQSRDSMA